MANDDKNKEPEHGGEEEQEPEDSFIIKLLKVLCCPIILIFMSVKIYCCGCIHRICSGCFHSFQNCCCGCLEKVCCGGCGCCRAPFIDMDFPASSASIGNVGALSGNVE